MKPVANGTQLAQLRKFSASTTSTSNQQNEASHVPPDKLDLQSAPEDFQARRLKAALEELAERYPEPSQERDPVLLRVLGRECRNSDEMEPFRSMLFSESSKCREPLHYFNGVAPAKHRHDGKTFDELAEHLDLVEPVLDVVKELAEPLPRDYQTLFRRTSAGHKEREIADGKFDYDELYDRGFAEKHITAVYASDNPETIADFGDAEETLKVSPDATFIREMFGTPPEVHIALEGLGFDGGAPVYEMYNKAGIDVCLYKDLPQGGSWFTIYNPGAIESVS